MKHIIINLNDTLIDTSALVENGRQSPITLKITGCRLYKGADLVIDRLRKEGISIYVISRHGDFWSPLILKRCRVPYDNIIALKGNSAEDYENSLKKALSLMRASPEDVISLCSGKSDVEASNNLGLQSVLCLWGPVAKAASIITNPVSVAHIPDDLLDILFPENESEENDAISTEDIELKNRTDLLMDAEYAEGRQDAHDQGSFTVDGLDLDPDNKEFKYALQFALESNRNLYLTGKAGSGKTTFLKYLKKVTKKNMAVVAPTGVAAINAGGQTIHSFFKIRPSLYTPNDKRLRTSAPSVDPDRSTIYDKFSYTKDRIQLVRNLELLVIDEVSMVRADLLDVVDTLLRVYRKNEQPFGGVQVILIGDTFQLPPVVIGQDRDVLMQFYDSEFFFSSKVIQRAKPLYIELKKIYRQKEQDFIDLLNRVRVNKMLPEDFSKLNGRVNRGFHPSDDDNYMILATKNNTVADINRKKLAELDTPLKVYEAEVSGDFPESNRPTDTELNLKVGAQVIFVKNDAGGRYYNGKIGVVVATNDHDVRVEIDADNDGGEIIIVKPYTWQNLAYIWDDKEKCIKEVELGSFTQFPLRLAWAITVHKSQGLTFEKVIADIGDSFASGQVYVALSRCTSFEGLVLYSPITRSAVKTDQRVIDFARNETPENVLSEQLSICRADFYYSEARKAFRSHDAQRMIDNFYKALRFRNDIDTDSFRRYVSVWTERLFAEVDTIKDLTLAIAENERRVEEYEERISDLENEVSSKESEIEIKMRRLRSYKEKIDSLEEEIDELYEDLATKESELKDSVNTHNEDVERISKLENNVKGQNTAINKKNNEIKVLSSEVSRLRNIKWYQIFFNRGIMYSPNNHGDGFPILAIIVIIIAVIAGTVLMTMYFH